MKARKSNKIIKNLLNTASILAISASAGSAYAAAYLTTGNVDLNNIDDLRTATGAAAGQIADNSTIILGGAHNINTNGKAATISINLYGNSARTTTVNDNLVITNLTNAVDAQTVANVKALNGAADLAAGGSPTPFMVFTVEADKKLTLGTFGSHLGTVTLNDNSEVVFNADNQTLTNTINMGADNQGKITVDAQNISFKQIGTAVMVASANQITINEGKSAIFTAGVFSTNTDASVAGKGTITIAETLIWTGAIGATKSLEEIKINDQKTLTLGGNVSATTIKLQGAAAKLVSGANIVTGNIEGSKDANNNYQGEFTITGASTLKGSAHVGTIHFKGNHTLTIADNALEATIQTTDGITTKIDDEGKIAISHKNLTLDSNLGTSTKKFNELKMTGAAGSAQTLTIGINKQLYVNKLILSANDNVANPHVLVLKNGDVIEGTIERGGAAAGAIRLEAGPVEIRNGSIGTNGDSIRMIDFKMNSSVKLNADAAVINTNTMTFEESQNGTGEIIYAGATGKTLTINSANGIGDVASATKALGKLQIVSSGTVSLDSPAHIKEVEFTNGGKLVLNSENSNYKIDGFYNTAGNGDIELAATDTTIKSGSEFGTSGKALKKFEFADNHTLNVENGVNFYFQEGFYNQGKDKGTIDLKGTHIFDAAIGTNNNYAAVKLSTSDKTVTFKKTVGATTLEFGAGVTGSEMVFHDSIKEGSTIKTNVTDKNTVTFKNATDITTNVRLGEDGGRKLGKVSIQGAGINFNQGADEHHIKELEFASATKELNTSFDKMPSGLKITNPTGNKVIITDKEGAAKNFNACDENVTIKMRTGHNHAYTILSNEFKGNIIADKSSGTVNLGDAGNVGSIMNLGTKDAPVLALNLSKGHTVGQASKVYGTVYADTINFANTAGAPTTEVEGELNSTAGVVFANGATGTLHFKEGSKLNTKIITDANAVTGTVGKVKFDKAFDIKDTNTLGASTKSLNLIEFTANEGEKINMAGAHYANDIKFNKSNLVVDNLSLNGLVTFNNTTIDLGNRQNNLTLNMGATNNVMQGNVKINTAITEDSKAVGTMKVTGASAANRVNVAALDSLTIHVKDNHVMPSETQLFNLITFETATAHEIEQNRITVTTDNRFVKYEYNNTNHQLSRINNSVAAMNEIFMDLAGTSDAQDAIAMVDHRNTGDAKSVTTDLSKMVGDDKKLKEAVQRITNPMGRTSEILSSSYSAAQQNTITRLMALSPSISSAPAAGEDDIDRHGAWFAPFYAKSTAKKEGTSAGSQGKIAGGTVGIDTLASDNTTIGIAASFLRNDIKHKDFKSGDKSKIDTISLSVYSLHNLQNNWYLQGAFTFAGAKAKNRFVRITSTGNVTATSSQDSSVFGFEGIAGYNFAPSSSVVVTPLIGFGFTHFSEGGYKETSPSAYNTTVSKKNHSKAEVITGLKGKILNFYESDDVSITPEVRAIVRQNVISKSIKTQVTIPGMVGSFATKSVKPVKTVVNLGVGINAQYDQFEYGVAYDAILAKKSAMHQGTLKVRVNF